MEEAKRLLAQFDEWTRMMRGGSSESRGEERGQENTVDLLAKMVGVFKAHVAADDPDTDIMESLRLVGEATREIEEGPMAEFAKIFVHFHTHILTTTMRSAAPPSPSSQSSSQSSLVSSQSTSQSTPKLGRVKSTSQLSQLTSLAVKSPHLPPPTSSRRKFARSPAPVGSPPKPKPRKKDSAVFTTRPSIGQQSLLHFVGQAAAAKMKSDPVPSIRDKPLPGGDSTTLTPMLSAFAATDVHKSVEDISGPRESASNEGSATNLKSSDKHAPHVGVFAPHHTIFDGCQPKPTPRIRDDPMSSDREMPLPKGDPATLTRKAPTPSDRQQSHARAVTPPTLTPVTSSVPAASQREEEDDDEDAVGWLKTVKGEKTSSSSRASRGRSVKVEEEDEEETTPQQPVVTPRSRSMTGKTTSPRPAKKSTVAGSIDKEVSLPLKTTAKKMDTVVESIDKGNALSFKTPPENSTIAKSIDKRRTLPLMTTAKKSTVVQPIDKENTLPLKIPAKKIDTVVESIDKESTLPLKTPAEKSTVVGSIDKRRTLPLMTTAKKCTVGEKKETVVALIDNQRKRGRSEMEATLPEYATPKRRKEDMVVKKELIVPDDRAADISPGNDEPTSSANRSNDAASATDSNMCEEESPAEKTVSIPPPEETAMLALVVKGEKEEKKLKGVKEANEEEEEEEEKENDEEREERLKKEEEEEEKEMKALISLRKKREQEAIRMASIGEPPEHCGDNEENLWTCGSRTCSRNVATNSQVYFHMMHEHLFEGVLVAKCLDCQLVGTFPDLIVHRKNPNESCRGKEATLVYWFEGEVKKEEDAMTDVEIMEKEEREAATELSAILRRCLHTNCSNVDKIFSSYRTLNRHYDKEHNSHYVYTCRRKTCRGYFAHPMNLIRHQLTECRVLFPNVKKNTIDKNRKVKENAKEDTDN